MYEYILKPLKNGWLLRVGLPDGSSSEEYFATEQEARNQLYHLNEDRQLELVNKAKGFERCGELAQ